MFATSVCLLASALTAGIAPPAEEPSLEVAALVSDGIAVMGQACGTIPDPSSWSELESEELAGELLLASQVALSDAAAAYYENALRLDGVLAGLGTEEDIRALHLDTAIALVDAATAAEAAHWSTASTRLVAFVEGHERSTRFLEHEAMPPGAAAQADSAYQALRNVATQLSILSHPGDVAAVLDDLRATLQMPAEEFLSELGAVLEAPQPFHGALGIDGEFIEFYDQELPGLLTHEDYGKWLNSWLPPDPGVWVPQVAQITIALELYEFSSMAGVLAQNLYGGLGMTYASGILCEMKCENDEDCEVWPSLVSIGFGVEYYDPDELEEAEAITNRLSILTFVLGLLPNTPPPVQTLPFPGDLPLFGAAVKLLSNRYPRLYIQAAVGKCNITSCWWRWKESECETTTSGWIKVGLGWELELTPLDDWTDEDVEAAQEAGEQAADDWAASH